MNKFLLSILSLGLCAATSLSANTFLEAQLSQVNSEDVKYMGYEPMANIVGGNHNQLTIYLGSSSKSKEDLRGNTAVFCYLSVADKDKNNEAIFGVGAKLESPQYFNFARFNFEAKGGIGYQDVKGQSLTVNTNVNAGTYASSAVSYGNYKGHYTSNTYVVDLSIGAGLAFDLTDNLTLNTKYNYHASIYDFTYLVDGQTLTTNAGGVTQDNHEFAVSLSYVF